MVAVVGSPCLLLTTVVMAFLCTLVGFASPHLSLNTAVYDYPKDLDNPDDSRKLEACTSHMGFWAACFASADTKKKNGFRTIDEDGCKEVKCRYSWDNIIETALDDERDLEDFPDAQLIGAQILAVIALISSLLALISFAMVIMYGGSRTNVVSTSTKKSCPCDLHPSHLTSFLLLFAGITTLGALHAFSTSAFAVLVYSNLDQLLPGPFPPHVFRHATAPWQAGSDPLTNGPGAKLMFVAAFLEIAVAILILLLPDQRAQSAPEHASSSTKKGGATAPQSA